MTTVRLTIERRFHRRARASRQLTRDQKMVNAIRELFGQSPLYLDGITDRMPWLDAPWLRKAAMGTIGSATR